MIKKYIKLIAITCLDFFSCLILIFIFPGFFMELIVEIKDSLKIIDRPTIATPLDLLIPVLFLLIFAFLVIYLNVNEYKKSKIKK